MVDSSSDNKSDSKDKEENPLLAVQQITVKENSKSSYSLDYILKIVKALTPVCNTITLEYSSKKPLRLEFVLLNALKVQFFGSKN
jgi:proliferating cell nuclear antigen